MIRRAGRGQTTSCTMTNLLLSGLSIPRRRAVRFRRAIVCIAAVVSARIATVQAKTSRITQSGERFTTAVSCISARNVARSSSTERRNVVDDFLLPSNDTGKYEELVAAKDRIVMLALQDAERYYRTRGDFASEDASDDIVDEAFDRAVLDYVRVMAKLAGDSSD